MNQNARRPADVPRRAGALRRAMALLPVIVFSGIVAGRPSAASAADLTLTVTTSADPSTSTGRADAVPGDGICNTFANVTGEGSGVSSPPTCTLRAAIEEANANAGHDTIEFAIPGGGVHRIDPQTQLPTIVDTAGVTIDGYTQPGSSVNTNALGSNAVIRIEVRGRGTAPTAQDGLYLQSSKNVIRGLALYDFRVAIRFWGPQARNNDVIGNFIGTDAGGTFGATERVTGAFGVQLQQAASGNRIGAPGNADRNVISGLADRGVALFDSGTDANLVQNNVVGLDPTGTAPLPNRGHGIDVNYNASENLIGGDGPSEGNVVSGNVLSGIEISHNVGTGDVTTGNMVVGNLIGTNLAGTEGPLGFRNQQFGVHLEGKPRCTDTCLPDIEHNVVRGNVIVGSSAGVMIAKGAHHNLVAENWIGVLRDGTLPASRSAALWGVLIEAASFDNEIVENVIAGTPEGVQIRTGDDYADGCHVDDPICPADAHYPIHGNTISRNSIYGITGLGIDLWPVGAVTASPDASVQGGIRIPDIADAHADSLLVDACAGCTVELFQADDVGQPYGAGRRFLAEAVADGQGRARFTGVEAATFVSATATDITGNTSEFSRRVLVAPGGTTTTVAALAPARRCSIGQC